jgi:hypothetical protein
MTPMTRLLIFVAAFGLAASAASACDVHQTHSAGKVDDTKVASVTSEEPQNMSTPETATADSTVIVTDQIPAQAE